MPGKKFLSYYFHLNNLASTTIPDDILPSTLSTEKPKLFETDKHYAFWCERGATTFRFLVVSGGPAFAVGDRVLVVINHDEVFGN